MKHFAMAALGAVLLVSGSGCCLLDRIFHCPWSCGPACHDAGYGSCDSCDTCGGSGGLLGKRCKGCGDGLLSHHHNAGRNGAYPGMTQGPPTGQVAYPYYTNRAPRDFLACEGHPIGP